MRMSLIAALDRGIVDLVQFQFGHRPLLTERSVQRLVVNRFDRLT